MQAGFNVEVVADAVLSRFAHNKIIGLDTITSYGVKLTSTEMALFELIKQQNITLFDKFKK